MSIMYLGEVVGGIPCAQGNFMALRKRESSMLEDLSTAVGGY